jgi:hypothetical protein
MEIDREATELRAAKDGGRIIENRTPQICDLGAVPRQPLASMTWKRRWYAFADWIVRFERKKAPRDRSAVGFKKRKLW